MNAKRSMKINATPRAQALSASRLEVRIGITERPAKSTPCANVSGRAGRQLRQEYSRPLFLFVIGAPKPLRALYGSQPGMMVGLAHKAKHLARSQAY